MTEKGHRIILRSAAIGLVLITILINIKNIFTSCHLDGEYQVALAYRLVRGDKMFSEMWEVHQTSAFFLAFFEWIFIKVTGGVTGIMVYANTVGVLCKLAIACIIYRIFSKEINKETAFAAWLIMMNANVKDCMLPDFANLQVWSAVLLVCSLIVYFQNQEKIRYLVMAAVCLCMEVLAYPGCVLVFLPCVILFWLYSMKKWRDIGIFTGICVGSGMIYLLYFMRGDPAEFLENLGYIMTGDETHAVGIGERLSLLGQDFLAILTDMKYIGVVVIAAIVIALLYRAARLRRGEKISGEKVVHVAFTCFTGLYILGYLLYLPREDGGVKYHFFILYFFVEAAAFFYAKYLHETEKRIFVIGQVIGFGGIVATLLSSDMGIFPSIPYLLPNLIVGVIPLGRALQGEMWTVRRYMPVALFCGILLFRNFIYLNGWMEVPVSFKQDSIFGITSTVENGPLKGIRNGDAAFAVSTAWKEWHEYVRPGDKVLILSYPTFDSTVYLYEDVVISADSVISTPTYSARQLKYWEKNPDKYPNVVAVKFYKGIPMAGGDNAVIQWLFEETGGGDYEESTYWRYFYLE